MYELVDYARSRLEGSVISIKGSPCRVQGLTRERELLYYDLKSKDEKFISMDDDSIDLTPIRLGYINFKDCARYASRVAKRRWKQGIDQEGVSFNVFAPDMHDWLDSDAFLACYYNEYPSFEEAYVAAKEGDTTVAFHNKWAINYEGQLFYRGKLVGTNMKLTKAYAYLEQMMRAAL